MTEDKKQEPVVFQADPNSEFGKRIDNLDQMELTGTYDIYRFEDDGEGLVWFYLENGTLWGAMNAKAFYKLRDSGTCA